MSRRGLRAKKVEFTSTEKVGKIMRELKSDAKVNENKTKPQFGSEKKPILAHQGNMFRTFDSKGRGGSRISREFKTSATDQQKKDQHYNAIIAKKLN
jgi:hypothetical protein